MDFFFLCGHYVSMPMHKWVAVKNCLVPVKGVQ